MELRARLGHATKRCGAFCTQVWKRKAMLAFVILALASAYAIQQNTELAKQAHEDSARQDYAICQRGNDFRDLLDDTFRTVMHAVRLPVALPGQPEVQPTTVRGTELQRLLLNALAPIKESKHPCVPPADPPNQRAGGDP